MRCNWRRLWRALPYRRVARYPFVRIYLSTSRPLDLAIDLSTYPPIYRPTYRIRALPYLYLSPYLSLTCVRLT
jgi:hypothetical protein